MQIGVMKLTINLDDELAAQLGRTLSITREKPATVLRMAIRVGLCTIVDRFQAAKPEGYFSKAYRNYPQERLELEKALVRTKREVKGSRNSKLTN